MIENILAPPSKPSFSHFGAPSKPSFHPRHNKCTFSNPHNIYSKYIMDKNAKKYYVIVLPEASVGGEKIKFVMIVKICRNLNI